MSLAIDFRRGPVCERCLAPPPPIKTRRIRVSPEIRHWRGVLVCRKCLGDLLVWDAQQRDPKTKHSDSCRCDFCAGPPIPF